jgi:hypothetical protein
LPGAEEAVAKHTPAFAKCATQGRGGSAEVTWLVPPVGAVEMFTDPEPEPDEWCLLERAKAVGFARRGKQKIRVHARVWVEPDGQVRITVTQSAEGRAVVCNVTTAGGTAAGTFERATQLAESFGVCYDRARDRDPSQSGTLRFELALKADGTVGDSRSEGSRRSDLVRDCALATARLARFPEPTPPARVGFEVHYVVE